MWVAVFLVCLQGIGCDEVIETKPAYHATKEQCEEHAIKLSLFMIQRFKEIGYDVEVGYKCDKDNEVKQING